METEQMIAELDRMLADLRKDRKKIKKEVARGRELRFGSEEKLRDLDVIEEMLKRYRKTVRLANKMETAVKGVAEMAKTTMGKLSELASRFGDLEKSIYNTSRIYSYLMKTFWLITFLYSIFFIYTLTTTVDIGTLSWLGFWEVVMLSFSIVSWKYSGTFQSILELGESLWGLHYAISVHTFKPKGKASERLLNLLRNVFPEIDGYWKDYPEAFRIGEEIEGKTGKHKLDVHIRIERNLLNRLTFGRLGRKGYDFIVKRFDKAEEISRADLEELRSKIVDIYPPVRLRPRKAIDYIVVVSTSGFTDDAIEYVQKGESWIPSIAIKKEGATIKEYLDKASLQELDFCTMDLIEELPDGYRLIWGL